MRWWRVMGGGWRDPGEEEMILDSAFEMAQDGGGTTEGASMSAPAVK